MTTILFNIIKYSLFGFFVVLVVIICHKRDVKYNYVQRQALLSCNKQAESDAAPVPIYRDPPGDAAD